MREFLVRVHIWIGERLGLTHYRSCWGCGHCNEIPEDRDLVLCDLDYVTEGVYAFTRPCNAVWCSGFSNGKWHKGVSVGEFVESQERLCEKVMDMGIGVEQ